MIGRTVGHYRILERLGGGGMGVVYKAEDTKLGRMVALKFLPPELTRDPDAKSRFLREARAASLLDHNNICTIYEIGDTEDEQTFIAMACYDGETLKARIERGPLEVDEALKLAEQIARGLGVAHEAGIVHRDIKPANVMLTAKGVAKILDFGLAKLTGATHITQSKTTLGTLAYMAPEQLRGEAVGAQADLWALGVVLFELLTGQRPFRGDYEQAIAYSIINEQPVSLIDLKPDAPADLERIVKKLLRKDPLQRYQTAEEVIAELEALRAPSSGSGKSAPRATKPREPLRSGARLGPYEIAEPLGSGGMGDVYRARDTRLDRQVAIKVLAPEFSEDAERKQRFQREAKTISSLSHPNICTLFDVGEQEGTDYLVMEYLEGETLADRLTKGALPLNELLKMGTQIGEALGAAHRQGVIHRDLKPANVVLAKSGAVKLLDFGLAKGIASVLESIDSGGGRGGRASGSGRASDEDPIARLDPASPDKPLTAEGAIVGTLPYMSPEQVEGREADARSDIFAFGAILYEMATGRRAFEGASKASLIVSILDKEPPLLAETQSAGASDSRAIRSLATIEHAVRQCLEKDPERRWQNALDVANELRWLSGKGGDSKDVPVAESPRWTSHRLLVTAALAALLFAVAAAGVWIGRVFLPGRAPSIAPARDGAIVRTVVDLRNAAPLAFGRNVPPVGFFSPLVAISHDGSTVVYVGVEGGKRMLFRRRLDSFDVQRIAGTEGAHFACFSPDDRWIAFLVGNQVKKVAVAGGSPVTLANVPTPVRAIWIRSGIAVLSRQGMELALVGDADGSTKVLLAFEEGLDTVAGIDRWTALSDVHPGGKLALGWVSIGSLSSNYGQTILIDLETKKPTRILERAFAARFVAPHWIVFISEGTLNVVEFDLDRRRLVGEPAVLQPGVARESHFAQAHYAISDTGVVAFLPGGDLSLGQLSWVDRTGGVQPVKAPPALYGVFDLSPDGRRLVVEAFDIEDSIQVLDLERGTLRKLAIHGRCSRPKWIEGDRIVFKRVPTTDGPLSKAAFEVDSVNDAGQDLKPLQSGSQGWVSYGAISLDARTIAAMRSGGKLPSLSSPRLTKDRAIELSVMAISPEGDWFAWQSVRTGRLEAWAARVADDWRETQVSENGGIEPLFCRKCPLMFFREGTRFYGAKKPPPGSLEWGEPELLWETDFIDTSGRSYDVSPDGERLLVLRRADPETTDRIHVIHNWQTLVHKGAEASLP